MSKLLTVIIPTYNPNLERLDHVLDALKKQSLPLSNWELIIIDNNSNPNVMANLDWHPHHTIIKEEKVGLTHARLKGFNCASSNLILMVDDDNILADDYLKTVVSIFSSHPKIGAIGGKSLPIFEVKPPRYLKKFYNNLALRDLGDSIIINQWANEYPASAPIGAGMALRKEALKNYLDKYTKGKNILNDRTGYSLSSGGDNDIVMEVLKSEWEVGYFPELVLKHIIPEARMQVKYLARLINSSNKSWIDFLNHHHINPWKRISTFSLPFRKAKSYVKNKAWKNEENYITWKGLCGLYDGLSKK